MSKKKNLPVEDPPVATASETSSGEYESGSSSEEEDQSAAVAVTPNRTPVKPPAAADSDSGSETESGSDSEMEEEEPSKPVVVTTSAKPPKKDKEVRGSSAAASAPPPVLKSALKRPATASKGTSIPPVKPPVSTTADSDSESGSDSEMEEEPSKSVAVTTSAKPKKARGSSAAASTPPPPALKSALKRPATATEGTSTAMKRAKTGEESVSKKASSQRVWSEDDEITILQGMIDFNADTRKSPFDNIIGYFDSVKKSFGFGPTRTQFTEKVRGLKNKYLYKGPFTKDHDKESMGLAKLIWGPGAFAEEVGVVKAKKSEKEKEKKKKKVDSLKPVEEAEKNGLVCVGAGHEPRTEEKSDWFESSYVVKSIASHGLDEDYVKQKWRSAPLEDKKRVEMMYKLLRAKEVEYVVFKTKFLNEVVPMIFKSS